MTDADFLWKLIAALSVLGNLILLWQKVGGKVEKRELVPNTLSIRQADQFVTEKGLEPLQAQVDKHTSEIDGLRRDLQANYNSIMKSEAEGRSRLHKEINDIGKDMSAVKASMKTLEGLPERLARDIGILFGTLQKHD